MKKQTKDRLHLCQLITDGLVDMEYALLELLNVTPPAKVRELTKKLLDYDEPDSDQ